MIHHLLAFSFQNVVLENFTKQIMINAYPEYITGKSEIFNYYHRIFIQILLELAIILFVLWKLNDSFEQA